MITTTTPSSHTAEEQAARNRLVERHLPLVPFLARKFQGMRLSGLDLDDLMQEGYTGLIRAAELYNPAKRNPETGQPYQFSAYASWWIRARILRALERQSHSISLSQHIYQDLHRLKRAQRDLWGRLQRDPTPNELAAEMQRTKEHILLLLDVREVKSLDEALFSSSHDDEATSLGDLLEAPDPVPQREQQAEVSDLLHYLSPEERRVIACRYQLGQETRYSIDDIPLPYTEVARQVQRTREHVKVVEERALRKLRYWAERPAFGKEG